MTEKYYGMRNDYMFKAVLQRSQRVLTNLVAVLLEIDEAEITSCTIENAIELGKSVDAKDCILDVKLLLNESENIDLEMQIGNEHNWPERSLLYWSRAFDDIKIGDDYSQLKKTYHIGILDFTLFKDNRNFYSEYMVMDTKSGWIYSDKLNIKILDLTMANAPDIEATVPMKLVKWARIFKAETLTELESLAAGEDVFMEAVVKIKELNEDEKIRLQCQARADYESRLTSQYNRGIELGIEQGIEQGIELGKQELIKSLIQSAIKDGKSPEEISNWLKIDITCVQETLEAMK